MEEAKGCDRLNESHTKPRRYKRLRRARRFVRGLDGTRATAFGVLALWAFSSIYDAFSTAYDPAEGIHAVGLAAATYLFFRKTNGGSDH